METRSPSTTAMTTIAQDHSNWQVVLRSDNDKVVLYNSSRNELSVLAGWTNDENPPEDDTEAGYDGIDELEDDDNDLEVISQAGDSSNSNNKNKNRLCPLCRHPLSPPTGHGSIESTVTATDLPAQRSSVSKQQQRKRLPSYFTLLSEANSRTTTPRNTTTTIPSPEASTSGPALNQTTFNSGYFEQYFLVVEKIGKGGNGVVHLVRHVLNGEALGLYACKRISVGDSSKNLLRILREVHLLESLQHPNIITYHHAWVEQGEKTTFTPSVPVLYILMQYANGGSLDSFISQRSGVPASSIPDPSLTKAERIRLFRFRQSGAIHLLKLDEIIAIFRDITNGLAFLHKKNILHLDMKSENVLLHWEEDELLPRAKLSDFGSSDFTSEAWKRERTGATGTVDWMSPELLSEALHVPDRATDQWALGLILHLLCYFTLPYREGISLAELEIEIKAYPGFFVSDANVLDHGAQRHDLPAGLLRLMARLLNRTPSKRPSCEEVSMLLDKIMAESIETTKEGSYLPLGVFVRRRSTSPARCEVLPSKEPTDIKMAAVKLISPASDNARRWFTGNRFDRIQRQSIVLVFAILRIISIQYLCDGQSMSSFAIYLVLLPTILDSVFDDMRISLLLLGVHGTILFTPIGGLCSV